jgi:hypothetical protein
MDQDEYEIITFQQPFSAGGITFEKAVTVQHENNEDFIVFLDQRKEVYARNVGLIYKEITALNYCVEDNCRGQEIIESGTVYKQELIEYGTH